MGNLATMQQLHEPTKTAAITKDKIEVKIAAPKPKVVALQSDCLFQNSEAKNSKATTASLLLL